MTERQAREAGISYKAHVQHYGSAAYGWAMEDTTSIVKLVMDTRTRTLLGAHICGPQASTLIQQLIQGMVFGRTVDEMSRGSTTSTRRCPRSSSRHCSNCEPQEMPVISSAVFLAQV